MLYTSLLKEGVTVIRYLNYLNYFYITDIHIICTDSSRLITQCVQMIIVNLIVHINTAAWICGTGFFIDCRLSTFIFLYIRVAVNGAAE